MKAIIAALAIIIGFFILQSASKTKNQRASKVLGVIGINSTDPERPLAGTGLMVSFSLVVAIFGILSFSYDRKSNIDTPKLDFNGRASIFVSEHAESVQFSINRMERFPITAYEAHFNIRVEVSEGAPECIPFALRLTDDARTLEDSYMPLVGENLSEIRSTQTENVFGPPSVPLDPFDSDGTSEEVEVQLISDEMCGGNEGENYRTGWIPVIFTERLAETNDLATVYAAPEVTRLIQVPASTIRDNPESLIEQEAILERAPINFSVSINLGEVPEGSRQIAADPAPQDGLFWYNDWDGSMNYSVALREPFAVYASIEKSEEVDRSKTLSNVFFGFFTAFMGVLVPLLIDWVQKKRKK